MVAHFPPTSHLSAGTGYVCVRQGGSLQQGSPHSELWLSPAAAVMKESCGGGWSLSTDVDTAADTWERDCLTTDQTHLRPRGGHGRTGEYRIVSFQDSTCFQTVIFHPVAQQPWLVTYLQKFHTLFPENSTVIPLFKAPYMAWCENSGNCRPLLALQSITYM